jgi:small subunit ribosomal protein S20
MPNRKASIKDLRKSAKRQEFNKKISDNLKQLLKKSIKAIEAKDAKAKELLAQALKAIDKAAQKGILKPNTRNRKKSRLTKKFNKSLK